jgi:hypothetical protein
MFDKVLMVGINYYHTKFELRGCINDVYHLKDLLESENQIDLNTQVRIMTDDEETPYDLKPVRENMLLGLRWLVDGANNTSKLWFSYSGHGSQVMDRDGSESDGNDETLCPLDDDIVDDDLRKILIDSLPEGACLFLFIDCCHSKSIFDLKYSYKISVNSDKNLKYEIVPNENYEKSRANIICFSGCLDDQTSQDARVEGKNQGIMSYSFIRAVKNLRKKNATLKLKDLMRDILITLKALHYSQKPQITSGKWIDLGETLW